MPLKIIADLKITQRRYPAAGKTIYATHMHCALSIVHMQCAKKRKKPATKLLDSGESPLFPCYVFQVFMAAAFVVFKFCS